MSAAEKTVPERLLRTRNRYFLFLDLVLLPLAAYLAFVLRLESFAVGRYATAAWVAAGLAVAVKVPLFAALGGYARYWPFASLPEAEMLMLATGVGELAAAGLGWGLAAVFGFPPMPRSVPFIELLLAGAALAGPRVGMRFLSATLARSRNRRGRRVLIVGAGEGGSLVVQEISRNPQLGLQAAGFVDDDPAKHGLTIRGVPVLGGVADIPDLVPEHRIKQVLIAIPTATGEEMRRIVCACRAAEVEVLTLPGVFELIAGDVEIQRFRPVRVEDLLARDPVQTDVSEVERMLRGERVLVTGAGGSIGSELCRQIAACRPARLLLLGHGETSIFRIHRELREAHPDLDVRPVIADTRDPLRIDRVYARYRPAFTFHAAAHKHVPLMEANPGEAVTNNVGGTRNLLRAAEAHGCCNFVMISTDKAVNPTSVMGATKRVAEHVVQAAARRSGRCYVAVRFGNVLGSRGSVVPIFEDQIRGGGPVTVTHPDVRRYFMTIPEAVQLVLQAAALGSGGEVFVLDMGEPVRIADLARDMIQLAGYEPGTDVEIVYTGLRPGEKLYEELFLDEESTRRTRHEKIFVSRNGSFHENGRGIAARVDALLDVARTGGPTAVVEALETLVPGCAETFGAQAREEMGLREED